MKTSDGEKEFRVAQRAKTGEENSESVEDTLLAHPLGWQERRKKMKKWVESHNQSSMEKYVEVTSQGKLRTVLPSS